MLSIFKIGRMDWKTRKYNWDWLVFNPSSSSISNISWREQLYIL